MLHLTIIATAIFFIFIIFLIINFGIQPSLSQYYYCLKEKNLGVLFYITLVCVGFLIIIPLVEFGGVFGFFGVTGLCFVGSACAFKDDKTQRRVHTGAAIVAAIGAIGTLFIINMLKVAIVVFPIIALLAILSKTVKTSITFWFEMVAFCSLFIGMLLFLL